MRHTTLFAATVLRLQLRLLRLLRVLLRTAAAAAVAAAVCCHGLLKVGLLDAAKNRYETKDVSR